MTPIERVARAAFAARMGIENTPDINLDESEMRGAIAAFRAIAGCIEAADCEPGTSAYECASAHVRHLDGNLTDVLTDGIIGYLLGVADDQPMSDARWYLANELARQLSFITDMTVTARGQLENADTILAALSAAGFVIVPREPTAEMKQAAADNSKITDVYEADSVWRNMLSAAEGKK